MDETPGQTGSMPSTAEAGDPTDHLLAFVRGRDVPCPMCRYNLRDLQAPKCPECGYRLALRVGLESLLLWPYLMMTISLSLSAGLGLLALPAVVTWGLRGMYGPTFGDYWRLFAIFYFIACMPVTLVVLLLRKLFLRLSDNVQMPIAIVVMLINLSVFIVSIALIVSER